MSIDLSTLPRYLTLSEAAQFLRVPDDRLRRFGRSWGLHPTKVGKELRFLESELIDYMRRDVA